MNVCCKKVVMKRSSVIALLGLFLVGGAAFGAETIPKAGDGAEAGQNGITPPAVNPPVTPVPLDEVQTPPERTTDLYQQWKERWEQSHGKNRPERTRPELPQEVKKLIEDLKTQKDTFWAEQKAIMEKLKAATEADREALKSAMAQNRENYREQIKETAKELQERLKEIRTEFKNRERDRVVDSAKEDGKKGR